MSSVQLWVDVVCVRDRDTTSINITGILAIYILQWH